MSKAYESIKAGLTGAIAHVGHDLTGAQTDGHGSRAVQAEKPVAPSAASPRIVACPSCGKPVEWVAQSRYRPFCSARCKGVDFGAWATEKYRVEASEEPHPEDQSE